MAVRIITKKVKLTPRSAWFDQLFTPEHLLKLWSGTQPKALHIVDLYFSTGSAKGAINPQSGLRIIESHLVPAMPAEPTRDILEPVRLMRPIGPKLPQ